MTEVQSLRTELIRWYLANKRDLPWRKTTHPYPIWVSEVMLQQTQVNTVLPYYSRFLKVFGSLDCFARADLQDVLKVWEGLGYYARARNFHRAAGIVLDRHGGIVPDTWDEFRQLPGVGDYIAAAVLSLAYNRAYPVVDGNVKRVLARLFMEDTPINASASMRIFKTSAGRLLAPRTPGTFNQAIMELGALVCKPQRPRCDGCPLQQSCAAYAADRVARYPKKQEKSPIPRFDIAVGVVFKKGRVLITRRKAEGLLGGLWEFPGGKIKDKESTEQACVREIREETNLSVAVDFHLSRVKHAYTHFKIVMDVFCCAYVSGRVKLKGPVDHRWIKIDDLTAYPFPKANHKFFPELKKFATKSAEGKS